MSAAVTHPGIYIDEMPAGGRAIQGVATSIALFIGWSPRGPLDRAERIASFADYDRIFGGLVAASALGHAVRHFYDNGGGDAYILRIAAADAAPPIDPNDAAFHSALTAAFAPGGIVDAIDLFNLIVVPGLSDAPTIAALERQARDRRAFLIVDCAPDAQVATVAATLGGIAGADGANAALYFPWVLAADPLRGGAVHAFPPSGFVAGIYARTDKARGVWKAPAGAEANLTGAAGLAVPISDVENSRLNPRAVNCLRALPGKGTVLWGARTLAGNDVGGSQWKYVSVRRLALFLEQSLDRGTQWAVFEPNGEPLWAALRLNVGAFLHGLFRQGAFQGSTPAQAYYVKCDRETTRQADIDRGAVNIIVGFAPLKPGEFIVLIIRQIVGANPA